MSGEWRRLCIRLVSTPPQLVLLAFVDQAVVHAGAGRRQLAHALAVGGETLHVHRHRGQGHALRRAEVELLAAAQEEVVVGTDRGAAEAPVVADVQQGRQRHGAGLGLAVLLHHLVGVFPEDLDAVEAVALEVPVKTAVAHLLVALAPVGQAGGLFVGVVRVAHAHVHHVGGGVARGGGAKEPVHGATRNSWGGICTRVVRACAAVQKTCRRAGPQAFAKSGYGAIGNLPKVNRTPPRRR
jgi:hypothetical protein